jgi:predicted nuclease of predicted toxin-antitoxin system
MNNVLTFLNHMAAKNFIIRQYKYYIIDSIIIVKNQGFKELFRQRGIKFLVIIITYYAIRDTILYIIIPLLVAKGLL